MKTSILHIEKWMREPRPEDLESTLTKSCVFLKELIEEVKRLDKILDDLTEEF